MRSSILSLFALPFLQYYGADFSSVVNLENSGLVYKDSDSVSGAKLETILYNHDTNLARIRIWTSTNNTQYSLDYGLALAKRAVAAGMELLITVIHVRDFFSVSFVLKSSTCVI